jgi:cytochrome b subunit of formate dehydrogenase
MSDAINPQQQASVQQQKVNEFLRLLHLTVAIAGLPEAPTGTHFNEGQLSARATTLKSAYKVARQLLAEVTQ